MLAQSIAEEASTVSLGAGKAGGPSSVREAPSTLQRQSSVPTASYADDVESSYTMDASRVLPSSVRASCLHCIVKDFLCSLLQRGVLCNATLGWGGKISGARGRV